MIAPQTVVEPLVLKLPIRSARPGADRTGARARFERGDTIAACSARLGVDDADTMALLRQSAGAKPFRQLRPGTHRARAHDRRRPAARAALRRRRRDPCSASSATASASTSVDETADAERRVYVKKGEIRSSLFAATDAVGLPDASPSQLADIFSADIDFHQRPAPRRPLHRRLRDASSTTGEPVRSGRVLAAEFVNDGKALRAVWFADAGRAAATTTRSTARTSRKAFLRSPLEFSRVTSGFSLRASTRFSSTGARTRASITPRRPARAVRATADGVVEFAGRQDGYGNVVVLRHQAASRRSTATCRLRHAASTRRARQRRAT